MLTNFNGNIFNNSTTYPSSGSEELNYNTLYYWTVRAIADNTALSNFSDPFLFSISSNFIPEIISPKGTSDAIRPYFSWSKIQNANKYGLIISHDNDYTNIIYSNQDIADNIFQYPNDAPALSYNSQYFWKVVAISDNNLELGDYSSSANFMTPEGLIKMEFTFKKNE